MVLLIAEFWSTWAMACLACRDKQIQAVFDLHCELELARNTARR